MLSSTDRGWFPSILPFHVHFVVCTHGGVCSVCVTCNWWVKSSFLDSTVFGCAFSFADDQINHRSYHPTPLETYLNLVISVVEGIDSPCNVLFTWFVSVVDFQSGMLLQRLNLFIDSLSQF